MPAIGWADEDKRDLHALILQLSSDDRDQQDEALSELEYADAAAIRALPALVQIVNSSGLERRIRALKILGQMGPAASAASPAVAVCLGDDSAQARVTAATALVRIELSSDAALRTLADQVHRGAAESRLAAAEALGELGRAAQAAAPALVAAVASPDPKLRSAAAQALGQVDPAELDSARAALRQLLTDDDHAIRITAAAALWNLDEPAEGVLPTLIAAVAELKHDEVAPDSFFYDSPAIELLASIGPEAKAAIPQLVAVLQSKHIGRRLDAVDALAAIGPDAHAAIEPLAKALRDTEIHTFPLAHRIWCVSDRAAIALRTIGPRSRPALLAALNNQDERVRWNAADALGHLPPDGETISALVKSLDDANEGVRASAAFALGRIGPPARSAAPALAARLLDEGKWTSFPGGGIGSSFTVGDHLLVALERIHPEPAAVAPALVEAIKKSSKLQPAMLQMLRRMGPNAKAAIPAIEPLLDHPDQKLTAAAALARIDPDRAGLLEILRPALASDDYASVQLAVDGLGALGVKAAAALPELANLLRRESECGQAVVAAAMLRIDSQQPQAIVAMAEGLRGCPEHFRAAGHDEAVATWVSLGKGAQPAHALLIAGLTHQDEDPAADWFWSPRQEAGHRLNSAKLLIDVGVHSPNVVETLAALCQSVDCGVRGDAADQLARLGSAGEGAVPALVRQLPDQELYLVGGDFYGNGGTPNYPGEHAAHALGKIGLPAVPALKQALAGAEPRMRQRAAESLGAIGTAAQPARRELGGRLKDRYSAVRAAAATALGTLTADDATINALILTLTDHRLAVRVAAAGSLGAIGPAAKRAVPSLELLQAQEFQAARFAAKESLIRIRGR